MIRSFSCAFRGIVNCIKSERNMRIHTAVAFYVIAAGLITGISGVEWICVLLCFAAVMSMELLNTAVEKLCDKINPEFDSTIGKIKDLSAGAVLLSAVFSAAAGVIIFVNKERISTAAEYLAGHIPILVLLVLSVPCAFFYVFWRGKNDR